MQLVHKLALTATFLFLTALAAFAETVVGPARVHDGDTLKISKRNIRLLGIDAPELAQTCQTAEGASWPCGQQATVELRDYIAGRDVRCEWKKRDKYRRLLGTCFVVGEADSINALMVLNGWALPYMDSSNTYTILQAEAAFRQYGMWIGPFIEPVQWRREQRQKRRKGG